MSNELTIFPPLKSDQIRACETVAEQRVREKLGPKPTLEAYTSMVSEKASSRAILSTLVTPIDYFMIPLLIALFMVSMSHMITFSGSIADTSYHEQADGFAGIWFSPFVWAIITQFGFFFMSEIGIIFFYNRYRQVDVDRSRFRSPNFWMSILFAVLTFVANIVSLLNNAEGVLSVGLAVFVGALVPAATLLMGDRWAEITFELVESKKRYAQEFNDAVAKYRADLDRWSRINEDPTLYSVGNGKDSYRIYLGKAIVEYYKRYIVTTPSFKSRHGEVSWNPNLEVSLAAREIANLSVFSDLDQVVENFLS